MKWPRKIRVGYRTIRLQWDTPYGIALTDDKGQSLMGVARATTGQLVVGRGQDPEEQANTVLHELTHLILKHAAQDQWEQEERVVSALAAGLCETIRDNPKLWRRIARCLRA